MPSNREELAGPRDPRSHTTFTFARSMPLGGMLMLPPRTARCLVRLKPSSAACEVVGRDHVAGLSSDWRSLPQDVLLIVVARLQERHVVPATAACNQWRKVLAEFVTRSKLSQLPLSTATTDAAHRKSLWALVQS